MVGLLMTAAIPGPATDDIIGVQASRDGVRGKWDSKRLGK